MYLKITAFTLMLLTNYALAAENVVNTKIQNTIDDNTTINTTHLDTSQDWNLTSTEWSQYILLMRGPSGYYYKKLSPPEVLGIQAETADELQRYAEIAAKLEHNKLEREIRFNAAFHDAAVKLYANEPIVRPFDYTPFTPIQK